MAVAVQIACCDRSRDMSQIVVDRFERAIAVSEQGYYSPTTNIKDAMPAEKYAFWYEGKPWVGAPDRGIKEGDLRDGGSLETRSAHVAYWHQWPDEYDHLIQKWDEFLSA